MTCFGDTWHFFSPTHPPPNIFRPRRHEMHATGGRGSFGNPRLLARSCLARYATEGRSPSQPTPLAALDPWCTLCYPFHFSRVTARHPPPRFAQDGHFTSSGHASQLTRCLSDYLRGRRLSCHAMTTYVKNQGAKLPPFWCVRDHTILTS